MKTAPALLQDIEIVEGGGAEHGVDGMQIKRQTRLLRQGLAKLPRTQKNWS